MKNDTPDTEWAQYVIKNGKREVPPHIVAWDIINPKEYFDESTGTSRRNFLGGDRGYVSRFEPELREIANTLIHSPDWEGRRNGKTLNKRIDDLKKLKPYLVNDGSVLLPDHSEVLEMWKREDEKYAAVKKAKVYGKLAASLLVAGTLIFTGYKYCFKPVYDSLTKAVQGIERLEKRGDLSKYGLSESDNDSEISK